MRRNAERGFDTNKQGPGKTPRLNFFMVIS